MNKKMKAVKELKHEIGSAYTDEDIIEGVEEKSLEEIIREVAEEENMTEEEVAEALEQMLTMGIKPKDTKSTKQKRDLAKEKKKKKMSKKSKKKNR